VSGIGERREELYSVMKRDDHVQAPDSYLVKVSALSLIAWDAEQISSARTGTFVYINTVKR